MENLHEVHKLQLKQFAEKTEELRTLAGNLSTLRKMYNDILTREQRGLIDYIFDMKTFSLFAHVPHKNFSRRWNRETLEGFAFEVGDKNVGFFDTAERAETYRTKQVNDITKDTNFWLTAKLVHETKTYEPKFSVKTVLMALHWVERELTKAFNVTGLHTYKHGSVKTTIEHSPAQLEMALPKIAKVEA
jgi:hypothetical protein